MVRGRTHRCAPHTVPHDGTGPRRRGRPRIGVRGRLYVSALAFDAPPKLMVTCCAYCTWPKDLLEEMMSNGRHAGERFLQTATSGNDTKARQ